MATSKPYKGRITGWSLTRFGLKTIVTGLFVDHPQFAGQRGHTSYVVSLDRYGQLETRNSRYLLVSEVVENEEEESARISAKVGGPAGRHAGLPLSSIARRVRATLDRWDYHGLSRAVTFADLQQRKRAFVGPIAAMSSNAACLRSRERQACCSKTGAVSGSPGTAIYSQPTSSKFSARCSSLPTTPRSSLTKPRDPGERAAVGGGAEGADRLLGGSHGDPRIGRKPGRWRPRSWPAPSHYASSSRTGCDSRFPAKSRSAAEQGDNKIPVGKSNDPWSTALKVLR
jgi:hypothetical protein